MAKRRLTKADVAELARLSEKYELPEDDATALAQLQKLDEMLTRLTRVERELGDIKQTKYQEDIRHKAYREGVRDAGASGMHPAFGAFGAGRY